MKLNVLDTASPAEEGRFMHLIHPAHGHRLYAGEGADDMGRLVDETKDHEPVGLTVRGWYSDTVQAVLGELDAEDMQASETPAKASAKKRLQRGHRLACAIVAGIHHIEGDDGKPLKADSDGIKALFDRSPRLQKQALAFSKNDANFFTGDLPT